MKFSTIALSLIASVAIAAPAPAPDASLSKRAVGATVMVDGLRYRTCPRVSDSCPAMGQYAKGKRISLSCFTRTNTTPVNGDKGWAKISTNGYWVAMAFGDYVSWDSTLSAC